MEINSYEGKVTYDRTSDTGDPRFDYDYHIGYNTAPSLDNLLSRYEGRKIKIIITIEEIEDEDN